MKTIAVLSGVDDYEALRAENPDMILASVSELAERLNL
jgi:phosphoglycolate phosphatase-like HAD superfamily hydrolase